MKQYVKRESFLGQPYINFNLVSPIRMMEHFDMLDRLGELFLIVFICTLLLPQARHLTGVRDSLLVGRDQWLAWGKAGRPFQLCGHKAYR